MRTFRLRAVVGAAVVFGLAAAPAAGPSPLAGVDRVVFLGDSNTYAGQYVEYIEAYLRLKDPGLRCEFLNLGLPSETVSGLTEPGHADGKFPRPDLHERLDRVLEQTRPGLVVACYGMNDGIYYPFDEARFHKFRDGISYLREKAEAAGARVLLLTPPVFDPAPIRAKTLPAGLAEYRKPFEGYDDVLGRYSDWLLSRRADGWDVVDVHGPMARALADGRARDPGFKFAADGVHADAAGHWLIAREVLVHWGVPARDLAGAGPAFSALPNGPEVLKLVRRRQGVLKDAWLSATGHKRPGMKAGLPLADAEKQAAEVEAELQALRAGGESIKP